ncbi:MAG TPA: hypothetical protein VIA18_32825, partial [Polyangia bacterium]|nr:hypothetical protein [Polyangia bacterium]
MNDADSRLLTPLLRDAVKPVAYGRIAEASATQIEAFLDGARVGDLVEINCNASKVAGAVTGFRGDRALVQPFADLRGLEVGARVRRKGTLAETGAGEALLGRIIDPFGRPLDGKPTPTIKDRMPVDSEGPPLGARRSVDQRMDTGVRSIDALLTLGRGQRVGIFAGAGVGKTVLMRQILDQSSADITVVGLIGERGCEVHDLLVSNGMSKSIVVAATSDRSPLERARGAQVATAIAEYFRDRGKHVLLVIDSLTRYCMALREIGLAAGELPATKGYPP